jgi:hypothetical protein
MEKAERESLAPVRFVDDQGQVKYFGSKALNSGGGGTLST